MDRPVISQYSEPGTFVSAMIRYRKAMEPGFSVHKATRPLRRISPSLVSLVMQNKRVITPDRVEEFARLLSLNSGERSYFRNWVNRIGDKDFLEEDSQRKTSGAGVRKSVGTNILQDWINVYVKDFFQIARVRKDPKLVEQQLTAVVPPRRVAKSLEFLLREGHLRRTLEGEMVLEYRLADVDPKVPSKKIRQFHKGALSLAKVALDLVPPQERVANTLIIPLDEKSYAELLMLIEDFAEQLKEFAARHPEEGNRLYQLIINLSPVGGKLE